MVLGIRTNGEGKMEEYEEPCGVSAGVALFSNDALYHPERVVRRERKKAG